MMCLKISPGDALIATIALWTIVEGAVVAIFIQLGHTPVTVCERRDGNTWENWSHRYTSPAALSARAEGRSMCEYLWEGSVPTVSFTGALVPEWYIFCGGLTVIGMLVAYGYEGLYDHLDELALPGARSMRWIVRLGFCSMVCAGWLSVSSYPLAHNLLAGFFFLVLVAHTAWVLYLKGSTMIRRSPRGVSSATHAWNELLVAPPRNKFKCILAALLVVYTCAVFLILASTPWWHVRRIWGPVLEWIVVVLIDLMTVVHGFDLRAADHAKSKQT